MCSELNAHNARTIQNCESIAETTAQTVQSNNQTSRQSILRKLYAITVCPEPTNRFLTEQST